MMAVRVVDTDVWSYLYKGRDEAKLYEPHLFGNVLVITFRRERNCFAVLSPRIGERDAGSISNHVCTGTLSSPRRTSCLCGGRKRWTVRGATDDRSPRQTPGLLRLPSISAYRHQPTQKSERNQEFDK
jgi:hypothetical protein